MATAPKKSSKSAFLRDLFRTNPGLTRKDAEEAWKGAGHEGEIGDSSFYNTKRQFNKLSVESTGAGEAAAVKPKPKPTSKGTKTRKTTQSVEQPAVQASRGEAAPGSEMRGKPARSGGHERVLDEVEDGIDDLIFKLKEIGGRTEVLEALRKARRILARSHES